MNYNQSTKTEPNFNIKKLCLELVYRTFIRQCVIYSGFYSLNGSPATIEFRLFIRFRLKTEYNVLPSSAISSTEMPNFHFRIAFLQWKMGFYVNIK